MAVSLPHTLLSKSALRKKKLAIRVVTLHHIEYVSRITVERRVTKRIHEMWGEYHHASGCKCFQNGAAKTYDHSWMWKVDIEVNLEQEAPDAHLVIIVYKPVSGKFRLCEQRLRTLRAAHDPDIDGRRVGISLE